MPANRVSKNDTAAPRKYADNFDGYLLRTVDAITRPYYPFRWDWGLITNVTTDPRYCSATIAGEAIKGISYGHSAPIVGNYYPIFRTSRGHKWILNLNTGSLLTVDQYWFINEHISGSRSGTDPDFSLNIVQYLQDGTTVGDSLNFVIRGAAFLTQLRNGLAMSPAYSGPSASAITAGTVLASAGSFVLAAGTSIYRLTNPVTNAFVLQGTAPFTVRFLTPHPTNASKFYAASESGSVAVTTNGGATWVTLTSPLTGSYTRIAGLYIVHEDQLLVLMSTAYDILEKPFDDSNQTYDNITSSSTWTANFASVFAWSLSLNDGTSWTLCNVNGTTSTREPFLTGGLAQTRVVARAHMASCPTLEGVIFNYQADAGADMSSGSSSMPVFTTQVGSSPAWAATAFEGLDVANTGSPCVDTPAGVDWHRQQFGYLVNPSRMTSTDAYTGVA